MQEKFQLSRFKWLTAILGILILSAALTSGIASSYSTAFAQGAAQDSGPEGPTDNEVNAIAKQLYCPVCENIPLDVCPTQACSQWRELIRQKLADGWSEEQIKNYFVEQYGERVLGAPPARGFNWLVYLVPPLAILAGIYILIKAFQSMQAKPVGEMTQSTPSEPSTDDYIKRLEEELREKD